MADDGIAQTFGQGPGDGRRNRRNQVNPVGTQAGRKKGNREDDPLAQAGFFGIDLKKPPVADHFRASDIIGLSQDLLMLQAALQVIEDVPNPDGLGLGVYPARGNHDGQPLHQVAENFKGNASGAQDHGRPEKGGGHRAGLQDAGHFVTGA